MGVVGGWRRIALGDIVEIFDGPHATPKKTERGPIFLGTLSNLVSGRLDIAKTEHLSEEDYRRWTRRVTPRSGDVVFSYETRLGEAALIPAGLQCCLGRRMGLLRPKGDRVDSRFLLYAFLGTRFQETLGSRTIHGSTVDRIPLNEMGGFPIEVPRKLEEQRAIAHVLGTLDDKIELNRRMNETLEEMARALFKSWFVDFDPVRAKATLNHHATTPSKGGSDWSVERARAYLDRMDPSIAALFPDSFVGSELGPIPEGWKVGTVSQLAEKIQNGGTPKRSEPKYWEHGEIPWLTSGEVRQAFVLNTQNFISEEGLANSSARMVPARSILVALYGATAGQVSMNYRTLSTNQAISAVIPTTGNRYFCFARLKLVQVSDLENRAVGSAQQNISKKTVEETIVLLPRIELRSAYDVLVEPLFDGIYHNMDENRTLAALRVVLLPKLMSGDLRMER